MPVRRSLGLQNFLGRLIPSELRAHQISVRRHFRLQELLRSLIPSELSSHQMAIRSHPGISRTQLIPIHFGIFGPTERFPSGSTQTLRVPVPSGVFPRQARASTSAYLYFGLLYLTHCYFSL